jgi:hypothetical protein
MPPPAPPLPAPRRAQSGTGLWDTRGHAKPQRPEAGWSWVVHDTSRHWRGKRERARGAPPPRPPGEGGPEPYAAGPDGTLRRLDEEESYLERRRAPKPRRRWFMDNRRTGTG